MDRTCETGHQPIKFDVQYCPLCDEIRDADLNTIGIRQQFMDLEATIDNLDQEFKDFKSKCVCGKLADE